jgi:hypothetical protein
MLRSLIFGFWILLSLSIFALWIASFASGKTWEEGLFVYQNGNIPIFHLIAECGMAATVLAGIVAWLCNARWGRFVTIFGAGMFGYSAINSFGWALHNSPALTLPMILTWVGTVLLFCIGVDRNVGADQKCPHA